MRSLSALGTALAVETCKLRRSSIARTASVLLVVLVPFASVGAVTLARSPRTVGATASKLVAYSTGDLATTHLLVCAQILSVATLFACGFVLARSFAHELETGTAGALFGLPVNRGTIALAKCVVTMTWMAACIVMTVAATLAASAVITQSADAPFAGAWTGASTALLTGLLGAELALPFAWLATVTRSQLGTIGGLVGIVALTQIVVVLGGGSWFPYAVPSLWAGMGGAEAATATELPQLLLTAAVAPLACLAVVRAWKRLRNV